MPCIQAELGEAFRALLVRHQVKLHQMADEMRPSGRQNDVMVVTIPGAAPGCLKLRVFGIVDAMCAHYEPLIDPVRLRTCFGVDHLPPSLKPDLWPGYFGPFIRKYEFADAGVAAAPLRELMVGSFGLIPHWSKDATIARHTYNARSETVHEKPSYRDAWRLARHCIIPAEAFFEPDWGSGKAVSTRISRADGKPMGIAGLWTGWRNAEGEIIRSYTMLTINADNHPVMRQFHKPEDEKRMVVILDEVDYDTWLQAPVTQSRSFLRQFPPEQLIATHQNNEPL